MVKLTLQKALPAFTLPLIYLLTVITIATKAVARPGASHVPTDVYATRFQKDTGRSRIALTTAMDRENVLRPGERIPDKIRKNLFVKVKIDKSNCYVGETVLAEYKLYSRLVAKSRISKQPSLNGFTVYDMIDFVPLNESEEMLEGKRYKVHTLRKTQLIPLQTGTLELDPMELDHTVEFIRSRDLAPRKGNQLDDLVDVFLDEESAPAIKQSAKTKSGVVVLSVNPLPDTDRPSIFNGAVGRFSISARIDSTSMVAQNAAVLTIEISGKGNLALIDAPEVMWPQGFESMDTRSSEELDKTVVPLGGTKRFEYSFIPAKQGSYDIPPVSFAYFDPSGRRYKIISTKPVPIRVSPGNGIVRTPKEPEAGPSRVSNDNSAPAFLNAHFAWILVVLLALIAVVFLWMQTLHRRIKKSHTRPVPETHTKTKNVITTPSHSSRADPLQQARRLRKDPHAFYTELNKVLLNTLGEKLKRSPGELYKPDIVEQLRLKGWNEAMTNDLLALLMECERNLYSSHDIPATDVASSLLKAEKVVAELGRW